MGKRSRRRRAQQKAAEMTMRTDTWADDWADFRLGAPEKLPAGAAGLDKHEVNTRYTGGRTGPFRPAEYRTSETHPIPLTWVTLSEEWSGSLGITYAPGKRGMAMSGGDYYWKRDLTEDMARLRSHYDVNVLVCLLEDHEFRSLNIEAYTREATAQGMLVLRCPIPDMSTPKDRERFQSTVDTVHQMVGFGYKVAVHCRGGHGRAGTFTAAALTQLCGMKPEEAIEQVRREHDKRCVQSGSQEDYVYTFAGHTPPKRESSWKAGNTTSYSGADKTWTDAPRAETTWPKSKAEPPRELTGLASDKPRIDDMTDAEFDAWVKGYIEDEKDKAAGGGKW